MFCQFFFSSEAKKFAANCPRDQWRRSDTKHVVDLELEGTAHLIRLLREQVVRRRACRELVRPVKPGPNKRGICMISVSVARKCRISWKTSSSPFSSGRPSTIMYSKHSFLHPFHSEWRCQAQIFLLGRLDRRQLERATETLSFW
ncbi:hypothetical protein KXD40_009077 [Peronospora effusa]|nr:hypothetical protein KXD40_009077 [Peronospora effusa]